MSMPPQLARAKRPKRAEPRPIAETLARIDIADLCRWNVFPTQYHVDHYLEMPFRYGFLKSLVISLQNIEFNHVSGYNQIVPLRWCKTGFGRNIGRRPLFICRCGYSVAKLYFTYGSLKCRRCAKAIYASQVCGKRTRPILKAIRLHSFIRRKTGIWKSTRQRLQSRLTTLLKPARLPGKRLAHELTQRPHSNYNTQATPLWS
jgi:hypothetical protein